MKVIPFDRAFPLIRVSYTVERRTARTTITTPLGKEPVASM